MTGDDLQEYSFDHDEIVEVTYYLTQPEWCAGKVDMCKLGAKCILRSGQVYENVILIPLSELLRLAHEVERHE